MEMCGLRVLTLEGCTLRGAMDRGAKEGAGLARGGSRDDAIRGHPAGAQEERGIKEADVECMGPGRQTVYKIYVGNDRGSRRLERRLMRVLNGQARGSGRYGLFCLVRLRQLLVV